MRRIIIELDGVAVEASLNEQKCPKICQAFWDVLPYTGPVINEIFSGNAFRTINPLPIPDKVLRQFMFPRPGVEDRSFKTNLNPGDVVLYPGDGINAVCISYGLAQFREGCAGPSYVNHLATVDRADPNYAAFMQKCASVYTRSKDINFRRRE